MSGLAQDVRYRTPIESFARAVMFLAALILFGAVALADANHVPARPAHAERIFTGAWS